MTLFSLFFFSLTIFPSGAPSCGSEMTSIDGVPALSNGGDQCTANSCAGCPMACDYQVARLLPPSVLDTDELCFPHQYTQCVELAQRYFNKLYGTQLIWPVQYAAQMCNSHPSGVSQTSSPGHGILSCLIEVFDLLITDLYNRRLDRFQLGYIWPCCRY